MGFGKIVKVVMLLQLSLLCFSVFSDENIKAASPIPPPHHAHPSALPPTGHNHHAHPPNMAPGPHHHGGYVPVHSPMPHSHAPAKSPYHQHAHPPNMAPGPYHHRGYVPVHSPMPHSHAPAKSPYYQHAHPPNMAPGPYHHGGYVPTQSPYAHPKPPRSYVVVHGVIFCKSCKYAGVDTLLGSSPLAGATVKLECNNTKYPVHVNATSDENGCFFVEAPKSLSNYGAHKCKVTLLSALNTACSKITDLHGGLTGGVLRPTKKYVSNKLPSVIFTVGPFAFEPECPLADY
ncbi:arabinogalactan protein 30 [Euphorbia peplus]|nr:arabinogalactan protein 30 [Euphorbia peplus]